MASFSECHEFHLVSHLLWNYSGIQFTNACFRHALANSPFWMNLSGFTNGTNLDSKRYMSNGQRNFVLEGRGESTTSFRMACQAIGPV